MKKVVLFALLAAAAVSASAETYWNQSRTDAFSGPNRNRVYSCEYFNYSGSAVNWGRSWWVLSIFYSADGKPMLRGTEYFDAYDRFEDVFTEGYKATWAAPVNYYSSFYGNITRWEYTFNPYGPQCKRADVLYGGHQLVFRECGDGHSRTCSLVYQ